MSCKISLDTAPTRFGTAYPAPFDRAEYPDIDLRATPDGYVKKDGTSYGAARRRT